MVSPLIESWVYVKITLKSLLGDGTGTKVINISNRPIIEEADGVTIYYPALLDVQGIGSAMNDWIPQAQGGSIVIDDSPGIFGYERRISDLLERYTVHGATIQIYSANTSLDDTTINAEWQLDHTTTGVTYSRDENQLTITVSEQGLSDRVLTKTVDQATFTLAPAASVGKFLPMVFGDAIPVKAILIHDFGVNNDVRFGYGTNFGTNFTNSGIAATYAKDYSGTYRQTVSPATTSTKLAESTSSTTGSWNLSTVQKYAFSIPASSFVSGSGAYVLTQGAFDIMGNNTAGTPSGIVTIQLCYSQGNGTSITSAIQVLGTATINKADYTAGWNAGVAVATTVSYSFDKPVVLDPTIASTGSYLLIYSASNETGASVTLLRQGNGGVGGYLFSQASTEGAFKFAGGPVSIRQYFYGIVFTDSPAGGAADSNGLGYSYTTLTQNSAGLSQTNPDLAKLELVTTVNGIKDNGSGTITGSASSQIRAPHHVIKTLDLQWDGSAWTTTGSKIDQTRFATALAACGETSSSATTLNFPRQIGGYSEGRQTVQQMMADICRSGVLRISRYNGSSQQFTLWPWGSTQQSVATFTDENSRVTSSQQLGSETVINRVVMQYFKDVRNADLQDAAQSGQLKGYNYSVIYDIALQTLTNLISGRSVTLYDRKELSNSTFDWISANLTNFAESVAHYFLRSFAYPWVYAQVEAPLYLFRTVDMMDVVDIANPALPSYFGTSASARPPYVSGVQVDWTVGHFSKRFKRCRALVEGRQINYSGFPTIKFNTRLLLNTGFDPT